MLAANSSYEICRGIRARRRCPGCRSNAAGCARPRAPGSCCARRCWKLRARRRQLGTCGVREGGKPGWRRCEGAGGSEGQWDWREAAPARQEAVAGRRSGGCVAAGAAWARHPPAAGSDCRSLVLQLGSVLRRGRAAGARAQNGPAACARARAPAGRAAGAAPKHAPLAEQPDVPLRHNMGRGAPVQAPQTAGKHSLLASPLWHAAWRAASPLKWPWVGYW